MKLKATGNCSNQLIIVISCSHPILCWATYAEQQNTAFTAVHTPSCDVEPEAKMSL